MNLTKVRALSDAGRFDLACECTTRQSRKKYTEDTLQQAALNGIYTSHITDGKAVKIFKTLQTNTCTHDCNYCSNSTSCTKKSKQFSYQPEELAKVFNHLHKNHDIWGLFLSSGIVKDADHSTEKMLETVKLVRNKYNFKGYIHFKVLPGTSLDLIKQARQYSTRMSINIEAASHSYLTDLSSIKTYKSDILKRQLWIKRLSPPSGQSTQMIVGATDETDWDVLKIMKWEYDEMSLYRMYYSPFNPQHHTPLENQTKAPMWRSHRLYNVDWLFRKYNYKFNELKECLDDNKMLPNEDPKVTHAKKFLTKPVDVQEADKEELLRVPGIGPKTAKNIINARRYDVPLKRRHLRRAGTILKRAEPFIKVGGWSQRQLSSF